jgi:hypothetical protein
MRVRGWQVMPVVVTDDGDDLEDISVRPVMIPAREWQAFKDGGDEQALEQIRAQIEVADD